MDLAFSLAEHWSEAGEPDGIRGAVQFRSDVFDAATIEALIGRLEKVLVAMTTDTAQRLSSMDLLDSAELDQARPVGQPRGVDPTLTRRGVHSDGVRRRGGTRARGGGAEFQWPVDDLSRA